ncbi:hypothetical protein [Lacticaseibacillus paracasei]|uniref:hypothetical protein n=1 Tax=Lacticaseibacillus paracasei TaxID=1597 RepID=UPI0021D12F12|nr:hypothetical protein [Lacticaseibacillus paracasei]MCU6430814.1 hypothetical protein [Lacticaseibacillus paracasei]
MLRRTKWYLTVILFLLIAATIGACIKNSDAKKYRFPEREIKLGQTARLYRKHSFQITHVETSTDPSKVLNVQEQRLLSDSKKGQFIIVRATSTYRSSGHIVLNVDHTNIYESSPFGTRRYPSSYKYVFYLSRKLSGSIKDHNLRLSVDNPDLPHRTRNVFLLTK